MTGARLTITDPERALLAALDPTAGAELATQLELRGPR